MTYDIKKPVIAKLLQECGETIILGRCSSDKKFHIAKTVAEVSRDIQAVQKQLDDCLEYINKVSTLVSNAETVEEL
jgi:hypothetical protein